MAIWNAFGKKKGKDTPAEETKAAPETKQAPAKKPVVPTPAKAPAGLKPQPEPAAPAKKAPATKKAPASPATKPAATASKPAAKAAPTTKKPAAPATKKPAAPATKTPAAVRVASEPVRTSAPKSVTSRPFFTVSDEDVKLAFDQAIAEAEAEIERNGAKAIGKYEFSLEVDGYHFSLYANNGQILFDSPSFTTLLGALNGIKTFKKTVEGGDFDIKMDKYKRYRFILANKYYGENYTTREQCQKCAESVRNFANNARILRFKPDREAIAAYEIAKVTKKTADDVDWNAIARAEAAAVKKGKFEICHEKKEYCFYLLASNGQILYSSRYYASENACRKGIDSFKRAAYVGNFFVDRDKFGNFRYVLKNIGSAPSFIGESYDNKPQCEKIIESVKNFIVTASIEVEEITEG